MTSVKVQIYRLQRNPIRPLPVMGFRISERSFLRIAVEGEKGRRFVDCSPLPHLHSETLDDCLAAAKLYFLGQDPKLPVSLSTALDFLQEKNPPLTPGVWENTALLSVGMTAPQEARVCKVKIGAEDHSSAEAYLQSLLHERSDREFRLDFNQASDESKISLLRRWLEIFPIAYIEEPFSSLSALKAFAREFPLALDEHLGLDAGLDSLAKAWVIKPNVLGYEETKRRLQDKSRAQKILSNVFESNETLQLYAASYRHWCPEPQPLGFGTAFYFEDEESDWDPKTFKGPWPETWFSSQDFEGELLWQN